MDLQKLSKIRRYHLKKCVSKLEIIISTYKIEVHKIPLKKESLNNLLLQENSLTTVLEMTLNSLMYCKREHFYQKANKSNGCRKGFVIGFGKQIELNIFKNRLGMFKPMILAFYCPQSPIIYLNLLF